MASVIEEKDEEIAYLKRSLNAKEMGINKTDDSSSCQTSFQYAEEDDAAKFGLNSEFNQTHNESQIMADDQGEPIVEEFTMD